MSAREFVRFAAVGVTQNGVNLAVFALLIAVGMSYPIAATVASAAALTLSYGLNRVWTFRGAPRGPIHLEIGRYAVTFASAVLLGIAILAVLIEVLALPEVPSQAIAILIVAPASYLVQRTWVFRSGTLTDSRG
jgi:putative flippase GtrA